MKAQLTERNTQIIAAYIAGNTNKIELAHYFGVSASTIRRVLAGFAMAVAMVPLAQASLLDDVNNGISFQEFTAKWESMTLSQQQTERALLRAAGEENILQDLRDNVAIHAPDAIPQATPQLSPQAIPQAIPQATPQLTPVAPVQTAQLTPQAIPQATPQLTPVAPVQTVQLTPQAIPQATPQLTPVAPVQTTQLTPQSIPQATPQLTPVAPVQTAQLTPQAIPQATPQLTPVAPVQTTQLTPQAIPQATPQLTPVAPVQTAQLTPQAIPQATPQLTPVAPVQTTQLTPQAIPQATPQLTPVAPVQTVQLTPQAIPQATPQLTPVAPVQTAQATPQAAPHATPEKIPSREPVHPDGQHFTSEPQAHLDGKHNVEINPGHANPEGTPVDNRAIAQRQLTADKYISASRQTVAETTATPAQQPVIPQQVRSAYYDKQITALNAEAEQNHAEVLAESHSRAVGDAQTLSQANDYTNKRFSDLKSQVDDNKDQANAGTASALAATGIPQVEAGSDFMVGAGAGTYGNQSAIAVGVSGHLTAKTVTKLAVSGDTNNGFGASAGIGWNF
ncbi:YadA-like family protein [Rahnella inusitata]|uniref:YadA C-terminal domain-containing protein n=1 Tax=Rahnella inusitata TaxID=58169 RepID=UPI0039BE31DA